MTLNIPILYAGVLIYEKYKKMKDEKCAVMKIFFLFLQINIISFAAVFGNNTGRYFYILVPMVIYYLIVEVKDFNESGIIK